MNKCFVTKLNGSSNNTSLLRIGEMRVHFAKSESPTASTQGKTITFTKDAELEIIGDAYFTDKTLSENKGKKITISVENTNGFFVSNADCDVAILDKYSLLRIYSWALHVPEYGKNVSFSLDDLKYSTKLKELSVQDSQVSGDIANLKNLTALTSLSLNDSQVSGDIANLKNLTALTRISLNHTSVSGDIANLKNLTALTMLNLSSTNVTGDIASLKNFTALDGLYLYNTQVSGDIANLKNLTALTVLDLPSTNVTGDIAQLESCSNIGYLRVPNSVVGDLAKVPAKCYFLSLKGDSTTQYTWTSRPSTSNIFGVEGPVRVTNIDKMLQDLAQCQAAIPASGENWFKTLSLIGTRTSASDAAVQTLQTKGYTVIVTPA